MPALRTLTRTPPPVSPPVTAPAVPPSGLKPLVRGKPGAASAPLNTSAVDILALMVPHSEPPPRRLLPPEDAPLFGAFGPPDSGKSTDLGWSLPTASTLWICDPGALEPIRGVCGYSPENVYKEARLVTDITAMLPEARDLGFTSVAIDDWVAKMQASLAYHRATAPVSEKTGNADSFYPYNALNDDLMEQRNTARYLGIGIFGNFWMTPPKNDKGVQKRGGASIPGNKGKEIITTFLDMMLKADSNPTFKPWAGIYKRYSITDPLWATKDRYALGISEMPMNIGEIMRYAGFGLPGSPWVPTRIVDWQEDVVDEIALRMWHTAQDGEVGREAFTKLLDGSYAGLGGERIDPMYVKWTMRDAVDRVRLWRLAPKTDAASMAASFGWGL